VTLRTVVALRPLGLGDLLTAVPALRGLRRAVPDHRIVLCTPAWLAPLARATGAVDTVCDARPLRLPAGAPLRPALAVNLHGRGPQSHHVLTNLRPSRAIAFAHPEVPWSHGMPEWRADEHEVTRWCRLLTSSGIPADDADLRLVWPPTKRDSSLTVVHPGAASASRRWPAQRFAAVARAERSRGRTVVLTGTPGEQPLRNAVARRAGLPPGAVVSTDVMALADLLARCGRLVCGDTGVAHLATALRTPSVVLFGPTSPCAWGPPHGECHRVLWSGHQGDPHGSVVDAGLLEITVEQALEAIDDLDSGRLVSDAAG
jgi:ADP-heptose:LPS heptosyltransferase